VVANPVADEKTKNLKRGAQERQFVAVVVKNKKYQALMFDIFFA
jgi:hypothetical protein